MKDFIVQVSPCFALVQDMLWKDSELLLFLGSFFFDGYQVQAKAVRHDSLWMGLSLLLGKLYCGDVSPHTLNPGPKTRNTKP